MSCTIESRRQARLAADTIKLTRLNYILLRTEWRTRLRAIWAASRRRRPVAIIWNSMATRIYQCILCGAEIELNNNRHLKKNKTLKKFIKHHNNFCCCEDKSQ